MASKGQAARSGVAAERILAVGGGKGGVGKSVVASNLAIAIAQTGRRTTLIDADLGAPNQHTLFGILRPRTSLLSFIQHDSETLSDCAVETPVANLSLIAGAGAVPGVANINHGQKQRLLNGIRSTEADVVIVDVGAGTAYNTVDLFDVADIRLLVVNPQLTSVQNAYAFLKESVYRVLSKLARQEKMEEVLSLDAVDETSKVSSILDTVGERNSAFKERLEEELQNFGARIIGNQLPEEHDARTLHAVSRLAADYLSVTAPVIGYLLSSPRVRVSINKMRPFLLDDVADRNTERLRAMADFLLHQDVERLRRDRVCKGDEAADSKPTTSKKRASDEAKIIAPPVDPYLDETARRDVEWNGSFKRLGEQVSVRICDVSTGGALLRSPCKISLGSVGTLTFDDLAEKPTLHVVVRNAKDDGAVGVEFLGGGERVMAILEAAKKR